MLIWKLIFKSQNVCVNITKEGLIFEYSDYFLKQLKTNNDLIRYLDDNYVMYSYYLDWVSIPHMKSKLKIWRGAVSIIRQKKFRMISGNNLLR
jgi:hypothetical protein